MARIHEPSKPVRKRFGNLVVVLRREGLELSGYRRRKTRLLSWEMLCRFALEKMPPEPPGFTAKEWEQAWRMLEAGK